MSREIRIAFCARLFLFLVFVCTLNVRAHGQTFTFFTIDYPGAPETSANGINASGQIVGGYSDSSSGVPSYGFLYSGGQYTRLPIPGGGLQSASGINTRGEIVGSYEDATGTYGFLYSGGVFSRIKYPGAMLTWAQGINASGQIVGGYLTNPNKCCSHGFLKTGNNYQPINYPGAESTSALGINASGQIVGAYQDSTGGFHGFLDSGGVYSKIDVPGALKQGGDTSAWGINASGQIVGWYSDQNGTHGFFDTDGQFTTIDVPGTDVTQAYGINDDEQIVGEYAAGGTVNGFVANPCGVAQPPPPLISYGIRPDGTMESTSSIWSGYAVTGSKFKSAKGSWKVPSVNCSQTPNSKAALWVGIDGFAGSRTLEQTGTTSWCDDSSAVYYAWYEFWPDPPQPAPFQPRPGDVMSASVTYDDRSLLFTATITDETTGQSSGPETASVPQAQRSSAEWIAERPCKRSGGQWPLADFGTAYFGKYYTGVSDTNNATDLSTSGPIGAFGSVYKITMKDSSGNNDLAVPSDLTSDGSFDVVWDRENQ